MGDFLVGAASIAVLPLLPILAVQGRLVRKRTPLLPEAAGPAAGIASAAGPPLRMLAIGESTVAGVGAGDHASALTGQTATALAGRTGRAVHWLAVGKSGATARSTRFKLVPQVPAEPVDVVLVALGVNDVLRFGSAAAWALELTGLIADLRARVGPVPVVLAAVPPMGRFPGLPQPLRAVLGLRAERLDRAARRVALGLERVVHSAGQIQQSDGLFCEDRFHPSVRGYAVWGELLAESILPLVAAGDAVELL